MLRSLAHVIIIWNRSYLDIAAATDGRRIRIDPKLTAVERRCLLAHDAIYIQHGHDGCQPPTIERQYCLEVARFLVSFENLQEVAGWSTGPANMAEEVSVTEQIILGRLATIDGDQIQAPGPPDEHIA